MSKNFIKSKGIITISTLFMLNIPNAYAGRTAPPSFTTQPANVTATAPATATFKAAASGSPAPVYQWKQQIPGDSVFTVISGATSATYTTPATTIAMSGTKYECVATNSLGSATSNAATLTVNAVPAITSQPVSVTVPASAAATFTVAASGVPAPAYQWQQANPGSKRYSVISGATSASYTTPAATTAMSGTHYKCIVSNPAGSVTSNTVALTVTQLAPMISITSPENNSTLSAGSCMTITVDATESNGSISSVDFYNGDKLIGSVTASPYTFTISNATVGNYILTAKATDANGNSNTSSPVKVTVQGTPVVNIVNPDSQNEFTTGSLEITALADEEYGAVTNVAFYSGTTLLGNVTSTSKVFTYRWINIPSGTYSLTAVATDPVGTTATSSPIAITINSAGFTLAVDDNVAAMTDALNHTTAYQYDKLNRLVKTTFADGASISYSYDAFGNQVNVTDQRGNIQTNTYDAYERLSQTKSPLGGLIQYNYDTEGHLIALIDPNGHAMTYTYDPNGKVLTQTNALNFTTTFSYDLAGNVVTRQDANGKITTYTYDVLNRLTNTAYPDGTAVANVYDALGRVISMIDSTGQTAYTYDALNRQVTKTSVGNTISYTYDGEGNRLTSVDPTNRTVANTYDALNRLTSVEDQNGTTSYGYDANSNRISVTAPNGVSENYTYDALNRILTAVNRNG
ncbi:MAG: Ig-like domain-containing protein, partial [Deltaproteobacteria bacterium]